MKLTKLKLILLLGLSISNQVYSQVTISNLSPKIEEKVVIKPTPYDSTINWQYHERISDYKKYIGVKIYIPPYSEKDTIGNKYYTITNFFSLDTVGYSYPIINNLLHLGDFGEFDRDNTNDIYNKDLPQRTMFEISDDLTGQVYSCSSQFMSFNIIEPYFVKQKQLYEGQQVVFYTDENYSHSGGNTYDIMRTETKEDKFGDVKTFSKVVDVNNNSIWLCKEVSLFKRHQIYSKQLQGGNFYFDGELHVPSNDTRGITYRNHNREVYDSVFFNTYAIFYILQNENGEIIAFENLNPLVGEIFYDYYNRRFILLSDYQNILRDEQKSKELKAAELKQKQDEIAQEKQSVYLKRVETFKQKYGEEIGLLVADKKVKIGMKADVCVDAWGEPVSKRKTVTENYEIEVWNYGGGFALYFKDNVLYMITE